jgi:transcriptional regulator with XRE-family HTH domain
MPSKKSSANRALARVIRSTRERRGYSQEGFARHVGMDRSYFGAIERGEFNVSLDTLVKIARGLDTTGGALCSKAKL